MLRSKLDKKIRRVEVLKKVVKLRKMTMGYLHVRIETDEGITGRTHEEGHDIGDALLEAFFNVKLNVVVIAGD